MQLSPITDYVSQLENEWTLNEYLKKGNNRIIFLIPKEEILKMNFDFITSALERIQNTPELIIHLKNRVDLSINDYENDSRELYEIDEVKKWIVELFLKTNCFPYLFALDEASGFLKLAFFVHIPFFEKSIENGRFKLEYDLEYGAKFIETLFLMLNEYCQEKGLSHETNVEITDKILKYFIDGEE